MALTASERISAITEISQRLAMEGWSIIDLTLEQFGLPTEGSWNGTVQEYVVGMVKGAKDGPLIALANHLGIHIGLPTASPIEPAFWRKEFFRVFISHLAAHRVEAAALQTALLTQGITSFVAHNDIEPTTEWQSQIELGLQTSQALVAMLHPGFHDSKWTDQELGYAMGRGIPVFSIRLGADPYGFIGRYQGFNGTGKAAWALANELGAAYRKNKETAAGLAAPTVAVFEQSGSFDSAKARVGYLEELTVWDDGLRDRVAQAAKQNDQITHSWGVPERVEALLKKWK